MASSRKGGYLCALGGKKGGGKKLSEIFKSVERENNKERFYSERPYILGNFGWRGSQLGTARGKGRGKELHARKQRGTDLSGNNSGQEPASEKRTPGKMSMVEEKAQRNFRIT